MLGVGSIGSIVAASLASTDVEVHLHVRGERGALSMLQGLTVDGQRSLDVQASRFLFSCEELPHEDGLLGSCLLYTSPSPRDREKSRMPSSA